MTYNKYDSKENFYAWKQNDYVVDDIEADIRYRRAIDWIDKKEMIIGEVGCKYGEFNKVLSQRRKTYKYIGLDIDQNTINLAKKRYPNFEFKKYDVNKGLPFDDESLDYLCCLEVVEHLENPSHFFREAKRVIKSDGKIIISVPNPYCWSEFIDNLFLRPDTEGHLQTFTCQNIGVLAKFSQLKIVDLKGTFFRFPLVHRITGKRYYAKVNNIILSRSFMYSLERT